MKDAALRRREKDGYALLFAEVRFKGADIEQLCGKIEQERQQAQVKRPEAEQNVTAPVPLTRKRGSKRGPWYDLVFVPVAKHEATRYQLDHGKNHAERFEMMRLFAKGRTNPVDLPLMDRRTFERRWLDAKTQADIKNGR